MASVPIALGKLSIDSRPRRVCAVAYLMRGIAYDGKKDDDRAIADYSEAIRINPNYAVAYSNRGNLLQARGRREDAIADFQRALAIDPNHDRDMQWGVGVRGAGHNDRPGFTPVCEHGW
jgi:tetratricopeptide (TPR) repeat protein